MRGFFRPPQFIVAVALLSVTLMASYGIEFREKIPVAKDFSLFPMKIGEWEGTGQSMEQKIIDQLDLTDYVMMDYRNKRNQSVNFYVAFYESQQKGESIHSPDTCLPGGGWRFHEAGLTTLPVRNQNGEPMRVKRTLMQKGEFKQLGYYWYPMRGRILTNALQMKWYTFWDALTRQRTDGALVRLLTPVYDGESVGEAEGRLEAFCSKIVPVLNSFLPD